MNIVILHCHFERGGVTQVVENHVATLRDCRDVARLVLLSGPRCGGLSASTRDAVVIRTLADFDYDEQTFDPETTGHRGLQISQQIEQTLSELRISQADTLLHWHNHSLGKNTAAPVVIRQLAQAGWRLLLQIHDFAEDNRPQNYRRLIAAAGAAEKAAIDRFLYPVAPQIHYAALTRADTAALQALGTGSARTHWLPNSVRAPSLAQIDRQAALDHIRAACELPAHARWCLYPVRGIRRKNVGEFLLLSRWTAADMYAGLTLRPTTPIEAQSYQRWMELARHVAPRARFDVAHHAGITYADHLAAAEFAVSTSVAEGFGLTFLEPWLAGRAVIARRLPTVVDDFAAAGLRFQSLYDSIAIPGSRDWVRGCDERSRRAWVDAWATLPPALRPAPQTRAPAGDRLDFASLTPPDQVQVLARLAVDAGFESAVRELSPRLVEQLNAEHDPAVIDAHARIIADHYSGSSAGDTLVRIYRALGGEPVADQIESPAAAGQGVDVINRVHPFFPCRTETLRS